MSVAQILSELPKLKPEDLDAIQACLNDLQSPILDEDELSPEEIALIESRLDECEKHPERLIPWEEAKARLQARFNR